MKCQNCGSSDIVTIQGQTFCINCGQAAGDAVQLTKPAKAAKSSDANPISSSDPVVEPVKETSVPDETTAVAVAVNKPATSSAPETPIAPAITHFNETPKTIKSAAEPKAISSKVPRVVNPASKLDLAQVKPVADDAPYQPTKSTATASEASRASTSVATSPRTATPSKTTKEEADFNQVQLASVEPEDIRPHPIGFALKIIGLIALPAGVVAGAAAWFRLDQDLLLYIAAALVVVVGMLVIMAQIALQYGLSRVQDGRPAGRSQWWSAARGGFMDVINVDLVTVIVSVLLGIAGFGLWQVAQLVPAQPEVVRWLILGTGNAVLAWLLIGSLVARHIAIPAVVIGGLSAMDGVKLGWQTFNRAGGHLVVSLAEVWLARLMVGVILVAGAVALDDYLPKLNEEMVAVTIGGSVGVGVALVFWFTLRLEAQLWLKQYRYWINRFMPERRTQLLSGRVQAGNRR